MKRVIILYILFLLSPFAFAQNYKETIQTEIDAINKMPLRIAYLVPLDSLGKVIEDEYMEFDQIHSYKILDDGHIKNANILITMYFDSDNNIRKVFKRWADGGALHSIAYYNSNGRLIYGVYNRGDETHGKLYADTPGFHIEHFPEENECNDCFEAYLFLSTKCMEAQYNIILQSPRMLKGRILRHKLEIVPYYAAPTFILYLMEKKLPKEKMA